MKATEADANTENKRERKKRVGKKLLKMWESGKLRYIQPKIIKKKGKIGKI